MTCWSEILIITQFKQPLGRNTSEEVRHSKDNT
jgi:hypothetical protein